VEDKSALYLGSFFTLLFLVLIGVIKISVGQGKVGQTPAMNGLTRWPEEERGRGTTNYPGGRLGLGVELTAGADPELDPFYGDSSSRWSRMPHRCRYPRRPGEVLEAVMQGPCMVQPPIPWREREWLYCPPAGEV
jgi:hypothetical protein